MLAGVRAFLFAVRWYYFRAIIVLRSMDNAWMGGSHDHCLRRNERG